MISLLAVAGQLFELIFSQVRKYRRPTPSLARCRNLLMAAHTSLLAQRERIKSVCLLPYRLPRVRQGSAHACSPFIETADAYCLRFGKLAFSRNAFVRFVSALNAILRLSALVGNVMIEARTGCGQSASEYRPYLPRQRWVRTANDTSLHLLGNLTVIAQVTWRP